MKETTRVLRMHSQISGILHYNLNAKNIDEK